MYEEYFGLAGAPFKLNPDPKFFFGSRSHNKAMAYLHYGLKQAEGFIVITGPVGAGKSMVIGHLLDQLDRSNIVAAQLLTTNVGPDELLEHILSAFRIEPEGKGRTGQLEAFEDYLFDQLHRGRRVLLIMDEAQNLPDKTLEELRMLSNLDYDGTPLFQVFLVGQPEFRDTLAADRMEQLKQRVIASYHLENLTHEETREYILHRLSVVGWRQDPVFTDDAFEAIYAETGGRPRRINTLCNRVMLYCSLEELNEVNREVLDAVIAELHEEKLGANPDKKRKKAEASKPEKIVPLKKAASADDSKADRDKVVVSIDDVRATAKKVEASSPTKNDSMTDKAKKSKTSDTTLPSSGSSSVLDRLRAKREDDAQSGTSQKRQEATLTDVASAIAAVSDGTGEPSDKGAENSADGAALESGEAVAVGLSETWRTGAARSIDDAREDLKQANAGLRRLRSAIDENEKRHAARRVQITETLSRADALIDELRRV